MKLFSWVEKNAFSIIFAQSLVGMLGSLYFSEIMNIQPCILCWYQRIALYPIVLISAMAIWFSDTKAYRYILGLASIGGVIGVYHNLLAYRIIPQTFERCRFGVPCTEQYINWFGFITIPLLSLVAYVVIIICAVLIRNAEARREIKKEAPAFTEASV